MEIVPDISRMSENAVYGLLICLNERIGAMTKEVEQLNHVLLEGNGAPPLIVQVATINTRVVALEETIKESKIPRHVWAGIIISTIVALFSIGISILK